MARAASAAAPRSRMRTARARAWPSSEPSAAMNDALTAQTVELLQQLIRNRCVNDGSVGSGQEVRTSDVLRGYLDGSGLDVEVYEPDGAPGRTSLVARIEGTDPAAPTLCLMGHTDVVPVTPEHWTRDPFGGELVNGEVWGRGALDMLNLTASQAVALKALAQRGWRPRGTLVYLACADEEAGGAHGAGHVVKRHWDALRADYLLTENGGTVSSHSDPLSVTVHVGEKGVAWRRLRVKGTPGHGSMPFRSDNALVKAAHVVTRLADYRPSPYVDDLWGAFVGSLSLDPVEKLFSKQASVSPIGTPLWDVLGRVVGAHYPGARLLPRLIVGFTDAPYFRERGAVAYGFGLFSRALTAEMMAGRFHGNDERIDVASLALTTQAWLDTCEQFLG